MTTTTGRPPARSTRVGLALGRGLLTGGVAGGALAALIVGVVVGKVPLFVTGLGLPFVYGLLLFLAGRPRRAREAAVVPRTALAAVEGLHVAESAMSERPVRFDLTVTPDEGPAFRVEFTQDINVVDLPDYRPGGVLVVRYPPDRPWLMRIVKRPTPEWEERAAGARPDAAPGAARVSAPAEVRGVGFVGFLGLLLGVAAVVLLFRVDLFERGAADPPSASASGSGAGVGAGAGAAPAPAPAPAPATPTVSSTWSTRVVSAGSGVIVLGAGQSFRSDGELRRAIDSLTAERDPRSAIALVAQEDLLSVAFSPTGGKTPEFDPLELPYERIPALIEEARSSLGVHAPQSWQLVADRLAGSLSIRISVTGPEGTGLLEADVEGRVLRRTPAS
ncbi:hypothetical protein [Kitasatospora sp. NPDC005856]|uniref:hypothetical protein n=1 Tax=Kitasatospora sp. NPDC005856 TaxID=3154566 RepID=UPI0033DB682A